jgi:hypothetical protein
MANVKGPIIEPEDKTPDEQITIRLRPEVARDLRVYGRYVNSSAHHVVSAALRRLFAADKDFKTFKDEHPNSGDLLGNKSEGKRRGRPKEKPQGPVVAA